MTRALRFAGLGTLTLMLAASDAAGQTAPTEPPPEGPAPAPAPGLVRVHAHSPGNKHLVRVATRGQDGTWRVVCTSEAPVPVARPPGAVRRPFRGKELWGECAGDVLAGSTIAVWYDALRTPHVLVAPNEPGGVVDLEVSGPGMGEATAGGISIAAVGGASALIGALGLAVWGGDGFFHDESKANTATVFAVGGLVLVAGGVAIILADTRVKREPHVESEVSQRGAVTRAPAPAARAPAPTTLDYAFRF